MKLRNVERIIKSNRQRYLVSMNKAGRRLKQIQVRERPKGW